MRVIFLLSCVLLAAAGPVPDRCFQFNGQYFDKEVLKSDIENANDFSYLDTDNMIFFSYKLPKTEETSDTMTTAFLDLDTKEFSNIPGLSEGSTTVVDTEEDEVYLAGDDGVYKFNPETKSADFVMAKDVDIWSLFYFNQIFYVSFPKFQLYDSDGAFVYDNPNIAVERIAGTDREYFMTNATGLFRVKNDKEDKAELYTSPDQEFVYKGFATDFRSNIYVFRPNGVYLPNRAKKTLDKVANFENLNGLVFVKGGIVYSNDNEIVKLTPSKNTCP